LGKDFERYLESGLAMGGLAIRPYVDAETGAIKLAWIQAPNFFPLRSNTNEVTEAAIATPTTVTEHGRTIYYTLLEFHEWKPSGYTITNELYRSEVKGTIGKQVPLSMIYPDLADTVNMPGFSRPLFVYLKPAGFNNKSLNSPLGIGVCENALTTLKQLNDTFDQFNWELKNGQRKIAVPESMVDVTFTKDGMEEAKQTFDPDQNVFLTLPGDPDKMAITDLTTPIRSSDYVASLNQFLKTLEMQVGLSAGTFSFDGQSLKTATEVVSENSMTYQTRNSHLTMVEQAIKELVISICELGEATVVNGETLLPSAVKIPTANQITVDFDDGIFTDKAATADYWIKLQAAGLCTDWQAIMHIQRVTEDQAKNLAAEIAGDVATKTPNTNEGMFGDGDA
jgi:A118 family predicted phage portal protein